MTAAALKSDLGKKDSGDKKQDICSLSGRRNDQKYALALLMTWLNHQEYR